MKTKFIPERMLDATNDRLMLFETVIDTKAPEFERVAVTSFVELEKRGVIENDRVMNHVRY